MNITWKPRPAKSLAHAARRGVVRGLVLTAALAVGYAGSSMIQPDAIVTFPEQGPAAAAPTQAERLVERHGCWTGEAPADMQGEFPGHVVVRTIQGRTVYGGNAMVSKALGQVFDGEDHGLTVIAFCR